MAAGAPSTISSGPMIASSASSLNPTTSSSLPPPAPPPKILLAKLPGSGPAASKFVREDDTVVIRPRPPPLGSLNVLLSDSWEFHTDRALPFMTENTDFTVVGVIGPPGVGKSTIMNELYGFDSSSPGMLPPFTTQSEETKAMARHCTGGIELRVSAERLILLDVQPIFSPSVLVEMMRPDGSSAIPVLNGESLSADLAHELMGIQLGVFLASICHVLLVVSEGVHDSNMWKLMLTVDLLKHNIPDPSSLTSGHMSSTAPDKEQKDKVLASGEDFLAALVFVHTKLRDQDFSPPSVVELKKALLHYFSSSSFSGNITKTAGNFSWSSDTKTRDSVFMGPDLFLLPLKGQDDSQRPHYESYASMLGKLRDQVLSINCRSFAKTVSEREWLRSSAKIWEIVKKSPVIADYCKTLQSSGMFRR